MNFFSIFFNQFRRVNEWRWMNECGCGLLNTKCFMHICYLKRCIIYYGYDWRPKPVLLPYAIHSDGDMIVKCRIISWKWVRAPHKPTGDRRVVERCRMEDIIFIYDENKWLERKMQISRMTYGIRDWKRKLGWIFRWERLLYAYTYYFLAK